MSGIVKNKPKPSFAENQNHNNDQYQVYKLYYINYNIMYSNKYILIFKRF